MRDELIQSGALYQWQKPKSYYRDTGKHQRFSWKGKDPNLSTDFGIVSASYDYGKTIGWQMKEGRDFSRDFATDTSAVILNEAAVNFMGFKKPVGETVTWWEQPLKVIGVIHNMVMESPYDEAKPLIFNLSTRSAKCGYS